MENQHNTGARNSTQTPVPWHAWNPGLDNDHLTLADVQATLPGADPLEISRLVRLFENPDSPMALTGAVSLERHDCIHTVLGRGLLTQDEAFVIGFTMGTAKDLKALEIALFKTVARYLYPKNYRLTDQALKVYELGLEAGQASHCTKIYDFPFEDHMDWTLGQLRSTVNIDTHALKAAYAEEKALFPETKASKRLAR